MAAARYARVLDFFKLQALTDTQEIVINNLLAGKDVFLSIKTGGGKSLCYQCFPIIYEESNTCECKILIITPLLSIMKEQCTYLTNLGLRASYIGKSKEEDELIMNGKVQYVFSSPESALGKEKYRSMFLSSQDFKLIAVDEAHTVINWSEGNDKEDQPFREWFGRMGELRSLIQCPMLVITATASSSKRKKLKKKLALHDCKEVIDSPDRENVKLFVKKIKSSMPLSKTFSWLTDQISDLQVKTPRMLIFFNSIRNCSKAYSMFRLNLTENNMKFVEMFHSCTPEDVKESIRKDMEDKNGKIRILLASSAAGMGVNYIGVNTVIHYGPPHEIDSFVQQIGRAGRDGSQAYELLMVSKVHLGIFRGKEKDSEMKVYSTNSENCRRKLLLQSYQATSLLNVPHLCCDICADKCECGRDDCQAHSLPFTDDEPLLDEHEDEPDNQTMWDDSSLSESESEDTD